MSEKFSEYTEFRYLYPPRPENVISPSLLFFYEKRRWIAQIKKNGTCGVFGVSPDRTVICMNRHHEYHKTWSPIAENLEPFKKLPKKWYYFVGEVLDLKTKHLKDTLYLYDVLVSEGEYLVGTTYADRYKLLTSLFQTGSETEQYYLVNEKFWIAKNFNLGFQLNFNRLTEPEDEGLVLRDPNAKLDSCAKEKSNSDWLVKCRKGHKNYTF